MTSWRIEMCIANDGCVKRATVRIRVWQKTLAESEEIAVVVIERDCGSVTIGRMVARAAWDMARDKEAEAQTKRPALFVPTCYFSLLTSLLHPSTSILQRRSTTTV